MSSLAISSIVFACVFGGALLGMFLRRALPDHHLGGDSKDTIKLGIGLIGTMGALVLGLMVGSAKSSYDAQKGGFTQMSARVILLDRVLARYGPEAKDAREMLRASVARLIDLIWPEDHSRPAQLDPMALGAEPVYDRLQALSPKNDAQAALKTQALNVATDINQTRWLLFQQLGRSFPTAFLVVLVCWFSIIFLGFGLFAPPNPTVITTLLLCALSVSGALFLILELDRPFDGFIQISSDTLRQALANLGR
jgi:hypothetical protein